MQELKSRQKVFCVPCFEEPLTVAENATLKKLLQKSLLFSEKLDDQIAHLISTTSFCMKEG